MAYDSPKAAHIRAEMGGEVLPTSNSAALNIRWQVARYLEAQGVANLFRESDRCKAELILRRWADHPRLVALSVRGQISFSLQ